MRVLLIIKENIGYDRIGIMAISAALKEYGHEVCLLVISETRQSELRKVVRDFSPPIVGYSAMTGEHVTLLDVNLDLKKDFRFLAVFGGAHATSCPQLIEEDSIDAICIGEGDESFPDFCRRLEKGEDYWNTPNFHVKHNGKIIKNPLRPLVSDLDKLPLPDRKILYDADPNMRSVGTKSFITSRGCPYRCTYCFNKQYNEYYRGKGKVMRYLSPRRVIEEIKGVRDHYPLARTHFTGDMFLMKPPGWIEEFCKLYKKQVGFPFSIVVRANSVKEQDIAQLKDAGLKHVWMGVECGNEKVSNEVLQRGRLTNNKIITAVEILHRYGVKMITTNMMGLPVSNAFEVDLETLDLNIKIRPTFASYGLLYPYPGTDIATYSRKSGHLQGTQTFLESNKRTSILTFSSPMGKRKIENLQKLAGIIVRFPILRPAARYLSTLPLSGLYRILFYLWLGYCMKVKLDTMTSIRKEFPIFAGQFRRLLNKS